MKLLSFAREGRASYGLVNDGVVLDLGARRGSAGDLEALIAAGDLDALRATAESARGPHLPLADVTIRQPLSHPGKILCVGVNYPERSEEYRDGAAAARYPSLFVRFPSSLVAHGEPIVRPRESLEFDYEGELALVIGRRGRRIAAADAWKHVAGVTVANDGSAREWVRHGKFNVTPGKNFDRPGGIGPWIATLDECPALTWEITTHVNGELRQHDSTARMLFPIPDLIAYISTFCTLEPCDLILTGTPRGAGARLTPPRYLSAGDRVDVTVSGVGTLSNTVAAED